MRMTPNQHEKNEWSRMAQAAYGSGRNSVGHTYSAAASLPHAGTVTTEYFDKLQGGYRAWLVDGRWPDEPTVPWIETDRETAYGSTVRLSRSIRVF